MKNIDFLDNVLDSTDFNYKYCRVFLKSTLTNQRIFTYALIKRLVFSYLRIIS